ncbi:MAG: dye decolorizing peroxidase [Actinomycetota bacterium]|nr:dye decolorizing peroxidase [Actinomycetota bacterium]
MWEPAVPAPTGVRAGGPLWRGTRMKVLKRLAQAASVGALGVLTLLGIAVPASAHDTGVNYRTHISAVTPAVPGLTVTASVDGSYLRVRNTSAEPVIVEGYEHEPYVRISSAGVEQNTLSPATYLNQELTIGEVPAQADAKAVPVWEKISAQPLYQFHDHRIHWMGNGRPAVVDKDPAAPHLIKNWTVPLVAGGTQVSVQGTLRWQPGSKLNTYLGYGFLLVGFGGVLAVGIALWRRQQRLTRRLALAEASAATVPERV